MAPPPPLISWADAPPYHYHGTPLPLPKTAPPVEAAGGGPDEARSLWIGSLLHWMDEDYLYSCFNRVPELVSIVIKRGEHTGQQSDGFGFLNFADHSTAAHVLQSYNGQKMPNADRDFCLNWVTRRQDPPRRHADETSDHAIFVGDLASDVTAFMLHHLFKSRYPSVKTAKVIHDKDTGNSKGYGFVVFGDASEQREAMAEMNGAYCFTKPMRTGPVPEKKSRPNGMQGTDFHHRNPNTTRLFVGSLDQSVTSKDLKHAFAPYGELVDVKVLERKRCGFVIYSNRASAEEAIRRLNDSELGGSTIKVSYAHPLVNKQDQLNAIHHGRPKCYGPGPGNGIFYHQQQPQVQ